jgi:hypothetical protein
VGGRADGGRKRGGSVGRTQHAGHESRPVGSRKFIAHLARQARRRLVQLDDQGLQAVIGLADRGGIEAVAFDDVRAGMQIGAADFANDVGLRQHQKIIVAFEVARMVAEPGSRARLDRAMSRMSRDLERLLAEHDVTPDSGSPTMWPEPVTLTLGRAEVLIETGRIQNYQSSDSGAVIALPANEYFDDECILDTSSSVGAFIQQHFKDNIPDFVRHVKTELVDIPSQRVPRAERRVDESYGIGRLIHWSYMFCKIYHSGGVSM